MALYVHSFIDSCCKRFLKASFSETPFSRVDRVAIDLRVLVEKGDHNPKDSTVRGTKTPPDAVTMDWYFLSLDDSPLAATTPALTEAVEIKLDCVVFLIVISKKVGLPSEKSG